MRALRDEGRGTDQCHCGATCSLPTHQRSELNISAAAELFPQELQEITFLEGVALFLVCDPKGRNLPKFPFP